MPPRPRRPPSPPSKPTTYLRLKHARTTILLLVSPLTPLSDVVTELLSALHARYPAGLPTTAADDDDDNNDDEATNAHANPHTQLLPIPTTATPETVRLAALRDPFVPGAGWREVVWTSGGEEVVKNCLVGEGGVLAFAFGGEGDGGFEVEFPRYDEEEEMEEMEMEMEEMEVEDVEEAGDSGDAGDEEVEGVGKGKGSGRATRRVAKMVSVEDDDDEDEL